MTMRTMAMALGAALALAAPATAQNDLASACASLAGQARETCLTVAQAAESAQPQLGILVAGGNPTLGTASTGGVRLGFSPQGRA